MEPTAGLIDQETAVLDKPETAALNCRVPETCALALAGEMVMTTGWRVMAAEADMEGAATLVAVTVTVCGEGMAAGAV